MTNSGNQLVASNNTSSYQIVHVENPGGNITKVSFNGHNYDSWSRSFTLALLAKGKIGYIDDTIKQPSSSDSTFETWRSANALVTAWIYNSMEETLAKSISCRPEARLIWDDIKSRFCQGNDTRIYRLESDLMACRQGPTESLMSYYGRITSIWDELMTYDPLPACSCASCPCDWVVHMDARSDRKQVRGFLLGLDDRYDNARSQILVSRMFPEWWGDRPRDRIYLHPDDPTDLSKATFVPDVRGRTLFDQNKRTSATPRANMAVGQTAAPGSSHPDSQVNSTSASLSKLDNVDLNALSSTELAELTRLWQSHKATPTDRLHGPFLEDGDWSG